MAGLTISEPLAIARFPRGVGDNVRPRFSQVHGLRDGVKRKRQELCAAIDGHSVNIHEIQNGRNLCSHTVPPNLSFECSPYSIRMKTDAGISIRKTYCAVQRRGERQILLYQHGGQNNEISTVLSCTLDQQQSPVVQLDYFADADLIFILHTNGGFELLAADTLQKKSHGQLDLRGSTSAILSVLCVTQNEAAKSILKARPDVIASLHPGAIYVATVVRAAAQSAQNSDLLMYGIWALPPTVSSNDRSTPVVYHNLSTTTAISGNERDTATFAFKNTRLVYTSTSGTSIYDLTSLLPRLISNSSAQLSNQISSINISEHLTLYSNSDSLQLYNSTFRSSQATLALHAAKHKRKRDSPFHGAIHFVCYFPQLRRAIATRGQHLVAVDLQLPDAIEPALALKQSSLLIRNIGKGRPQSSTPAETQEHSTGNPLGSVANPNAATKEWNVVRDRLDECISDKDTQGFEHTLLAYVAGSPDTETSTSVPVFEEVIDYVISTVFQGSASPEEPRDQADDSLKLDFPAFGIINWLSPRGYLTLSRIQSAITRKSPSSSWSLKPGAICQALWYADTSLSMLRAYLQSAPRIDVSELCHAIKFLVREALKVASLKPDNLVETAKPNHYRQDDVDQQTDVSNNTSQNIELSLAECLVAALKKLANKDQRTVIPALRSILDQQDMVTTIQFLRQQLFHTGYTRALQAQSYPSPPPSEAEFADQHVDLKNQQHRYLSLDNIVIILSSSIDALGPLGIISMGDNDQFLQTLVTDLSLEISRALASLEDAAYLQGLLRETLRFSESSSKPDLAKNDQEGDKIRSQKRGTIQTLYSELESDSIEGLSSILPLSLRPTHKISLMKVRKGDGQVAPRSKREMGMLQDRLRAPYSLERLVL